MCCEKLAKIVSEQEIINSNNNRLCDSLHIIDKKLNELESQLCGAKKKKIENCEEDIKKLQLRLPEELSFVHNRVNCNLKKIDGLEDRVKTIELNYMQTNGLKPKDSKREAEDEEWMNAPMGEPKPFRGTAEQLDVKPKREVEHIVDANEKVKDELDKN